MGNTKLQRYLHKKRHTDNGTPIRKTEVQENPDKHIDQDFEGFPHQPSTEGMISPKTKTQRKLAAVGKKDGEKMTTKKEKKSKEKNDDQSLGSGGAFEATELPRDDEN